MTEENPEVFSPEEEARAQLAAIVESSDDAIIGKTLDGIITSWNRGAQRIYGYTPEEVIGQPISILIPPDRPEELPQIMEQLRRGERIDHYETERIAKDGERLTISLSISPVRDSRNRIIGAATIARDVTVRRRQEVIIRDALERTQELYYVSRRIGLASTTREIVDILVSTSYLRESFIALVFVFDTLWEDTPPAFMTVEAAWRRDPEIPEIKGMQVSLQGFRLANLFAREGPIAIHDAHSDPRLHESARQVLEAMKSRSFIVFPLLASGHWFGSFVAFWDQPLPLSEEDIRHTNGLVDQAAAGIYSLLSFRAEARARLDAEEANQLKMKFLAMVSHELRTPLTSIKGFATTLLQPEVTFSPEDQQDFIGIINEEADHLGDLIDQLLDMTRLEAGTLAIDIKDQSIQEVVSGIIPELYILCASHELTLDILDGLPRVRADARRVGQVITNLVDNACKYSPAGTQITIQARQQDQMMVVSVRDEGPGIPPAERGLIFEPFRQAENRPSHERGSGLGLAIARGVIEAHGGRIWVSEDPPPGTQFCFTLPLSRE